MIQAWVDKEGRVHTGYTHWTIANELFPNAYNPELSCEKLGMVKLGTSYSCSPYMENYCEETATQAQINTVTKLWEEHYKEKINNERCNINYINAYLLS